jgi:acyltransferase
MSKSNTIDIIKGIGILLVLIGHSNFGYYALTFIYAFHMPLFFFVSGYLFHYEKYKDSIAFVKNKSKRLLLPFFITNLILLCTRSVTSFISGGLHAAIDPIPILLIQTLYGNGAPSSPPFMIGTAIDTPAWFLTSLFCGICVLYCVAWIKEKYGMIIAAFVSVLLVLFGFVIKSYAFLPWGFDIACTVMMFMVPGYLIYSYKNKIIDPSITRAVVAFVLLILVVIFNGTVDMNQRIYSNNLLFFGVGGLCGTYLTFYIANKISPYDNKITEFLIFMGRNSLILFVYQGFALGVLEKILDLFTHTGSLIEGSPFLRATCMIVGSILMVLIIKRIPILCDVY